MGKIKILHPQKYSISYGYVYQCKQLRMNRLGTLPRWVLISFICYYLS